MATVPPPAFTNRLAQETSPYLLQHQHNPVDWYPWGNEAFEQARLSNRPIFLSVGYSTCYWCHVMERQCFEVESIAELMNRHFVNIKVDREERPDVDQLYMTALQLMTRHGGWPMSVWLTPDLKPFYAGTYFPPTDAHGRPGFPAVIDALGDAWHNRRGEIDASADELVRLLRSVAEAKPHQTTLTAAQIDRIVIRSCDDYEPEHGGFGQSPKFPRQTLLRLLLAWLETREPDDAERSRVARMVRHTLDAMANGGIRDHLGGGFHRYSTDARWLVPHFEIMLYDQAMLAPVYARAARILGEPRYATVARGICDFVLREMTGPAGEFYTAFDAEVDHQEGLNYLWTPQQVADVLGQADAKTFARVYGLDRGPNFADPHHGSGTPDQNILYLPEGPAMESDPAIVAMRGKLLAARAERKQPLLDTKVITSWNAMMIEALAVVARELSDTGYRDAAVRAADFLLREHLNEGGTLIRTSRGGVTKYEGFLDDYAFLAAALLELQATTRDLRWKRQAETFATTMLRLFGEDGASSAGSGGLYFTAVTATDLIVRQKTATDSPLPSGNAVAALALHELGKTERARQIVGEFAAQLSDYGESMSSMLEVAMLLERLPAIDPRLDLTPAMPAPLATEEAVVGLTARRVTDMRIDATITIKRGYHLHDTNTDPRLNLHATRLRVSGAHADLVEFIDYPPAQLIQPPFGPTVAGYRGELIVNVLFKDAAPLEPIELSLSFQACDDQACLRPSVLTTTV